MQIKTDSSPSSKIGAVFAILFIRSVRQSAFRPLLLRSAQAGPTFCQAADEQFPFLSEQDGWG